MNTIDTVRHASDQDLSRWTKRIGLLVILVFFVFVAFYAVDRWRAPAPSIVDQQVVAFEQAVRDNPNDIAVRGQLADVYLAKGRLQDAIDQYDIIIATGVSIEPAQLGRAQALLGLGHLDEAAAAFEAVVDIAAGGEMAIVDLSLQTAYYGLGSIAMQQDRPADAIGYLEKALAISRSDADSMYLLGTAFIATGELEKAITMLRASVTFVPTGWSEPYVALATAYTAGGQPALAVWATAMADLVGGKADAAEDALLGLVDGAAGLDAAIGLGLLYEMRGDVATAAEWYRRALEMEPGSSAAQLGLSRVGPAPTAEGTGS